MLFSKNLKNNYEIDNQIIYIKGEEIYLKILDKIIKALDILINKLNKKYKFIIRSNMSTFINLDLLYKKLLLLQKNNVYTGGQRFILKSYDIPCGIKDNKYFELNI